MVRDDEIKKTIEFVERLKWSALIDAQLPL